MHVLVTRRLTLRTPTWLDAEDIAAGLNDWSVARMLAKVPYPYHAADACEWIDSLKDSPDSLVYTIHRERLIGVVSLEGEGRELRLGYWLAAHAQGHGLMTEAAGALLDHAFASGRVDAVSSSVFVDNPASLRVQEKLGFRLTGVSQTYSRSRGTALQALTTRLERAPADVSEQAPPHVCEAA